MVRALFFDSFVDGFGDARIVCQHRLCGLGWHRDCWNDSSGDGDTRGKCQHAKAALSDVHPDRYSGVAPGSRMTTGFLRPNKKAVSSVNDTAFLLR